jgi:hypothetical protein
MSIVALRDVRAAFGPVEISGLKEISGGRRGAPQKERQI